MFVLFKIYEYTLINCIFMNGTVSTAVTLLYCIILGPINISNSGIVVTINCPQPINFNTFAV